MKTKLKILNSTILIILILSLSGCASYFNSERELYAGEEITPNQLYEISQALVESNNDTDKIEDVTEPFVQDTDNEGNLLVYWTKSGEVWHINKECSALANSVNIESGTEEVAIVNGKERLCKRCGELIVDENISK